MLQPTRAADEHSLSPVSQVPVSAGIAHRQGANHWAWEACKRQTVSCQLSREGRRRGRVCCEKGKDSSLQAGCSQLWDGRLCTALSLAGVSHNSPRST